MPSGLGGCDWAGNYLDQSSGFQVDARSATGNYLADHILPVLALDLNGFLTGMFAAVLDFDAVLEG